MAMCNAFGSRTAPSRRKAFGQHASRLAEVCESPLANKTTSCPSATSSSPNHEMTRSVLPYSLGGMASVKGAICAICMHNPVWKSDWALHAATAKPRFARRARPDGTLRPLREPQSRQRETGLAQSEKRKLSCPQSVGLPPQVGARGGQPLPSHSTRRELLQSSAVGLAMGGRRYSVPPFE